MAVKLLVGEKGLIRIENKRKIIMLIRDFVKFPSDNPIFRCDIITNTLQEMYDDEEISTAHYKFFNRAVQIELAVILNDEIMAANQYGYV